MWPFDGGPVDRNEEWGGPVFVPSGALVNCATNEQIEDVQLLQGGNRVKILTVPTSSAQDGIVDKRHPLDPKQQKKQGVSDSLCSASLKNQEKLLTDEPLHLQSQSITHQGHRVGMCLFWHIMLGRSGQRASGAVPIFDPPHQLSTHSRRRIPI
ncbi:unnamed protein product [Leuciscus chuanchicus]